MNFNLNYTKSIFEDFSIIGFLCFIMLLAECLIRNIVRVLTKIYAKYPTASMVAFLSIMFIAMGLLGKSDMDAEIALYGH